LETMQSSIYERTVIRAYHGTIPDDQLISEVLLASMIFRRSR